MSKVVDTSPDAKGQWEDVDINPRATRIGVPGGWIYYIEPSHREPCAVFVPEPVGYRLNCQRCNAEAALDPHQCPLKGTVCTCGVSCSEHCRLENDQS